MGKRILPALYAIQFYTKQACLIAAMQPVLRNICTKTEAAVPAAWAPLIDGKAVAGVFAQLSSGAWDAIPARDRVFEALRYTDPAGVVAVVLGQDPYPCPEDAQGLAFSVPRGRPLPPSLQNVLACVERTAGGGPPPDRKASPSGDLRPWALQGVLLLNMALTTRPGVRGSHLALWRPVVAGLVDRLCAARAGTPGNQLYFFLWGSAARAFAPLVRSHGHVALEWTRPSAGAQAPEERLAGAGGPPDADPTGFTACPHFAELGAALSAAGRRPICWDRNTEAVAYCDGACAANGRAGACAGFAAVFSGGPFGDCGGAHPTYVLGRVAPEAYALADERAPTGGLRLAGGAVAPSNNRGELLGLIHVFQGLLRCARLGGVTRALIVSDSKISIQTFDDWLPARLRRGTARELKNFDLVWAGWLLYCELKTVCDVRLQHIRSHQAAPAADAPGYRFGTLTVPAAAARAGNALADRLAGEAVALPDCEVRYGGLAALRP